VLSAAVRLGGKGPRERISTSVYTLVLGNILAESDGVEPASLLREPVFSRQVPYRPAHSPLNCQRTTQIW
jgi:hypothetical protein